MKRGHFVSAVLGFMLVAIVWREIALPPRISGRQKNLAIRTIKDYSAVEKAAVFQEGRNLDLAITVDYATPKESARELGEIFVRLVQTLGPETVPGAVVRKGMFSYVVSVYYPSGELLVMGTKSRTGDHIIW